MAQRVSVCIPTYDGSVPVPLAGALLAETRIADRVGIDLDFKFLSGCTNLALGRNQLVREFLESDAERLMFVDADVTFEMGALARLVSYPELFVGGCYRFKREEEAYPIAWLENLPELRANVNGLLQVRMLPTGFLSLHRDVFTRFRAHYGDDRIYEKEKGTYAFFEIPLKNSMLYTEDAYFCQLWHDMGGEMWLAPEITLTHWNGNIPFVGHIGNFLKRRAGLPTLAELGADALLTKGDSHGKEAGSRIPEVDVSPREGSQDLQKLG